MANESTPLGATIPVLLLPGIPLPDEFLPTGGVLDIYAQEDKLLRVEDVSGFREGVAGDDLVRELAVSNQPAHCRPVVLAFRAGIFVRGDAGVAAGGDWG